MCTFFPRLPVSIQFGIGRDGPFTRGSGLGIQETRAYAQIISMCFCRCSVGNPHSTSGTCPVIQGAPFTGEALFTRIAVDHIYPL